MNRLEFSKSLASDAGRLAHSAFGQSATSMKGRHDVVTAMDREVERFIRKAIAAHYPDDTIIGEEEGGGGATERVWLIDPIDGTANYARGIPALLRVDRLPRGARPDGRRHLRPEPRLALRSRARRRRVAQRRAPRRQPGERPRCGDRRMRVVDPAQHRRLHRAGRPRDGSGLRDAPRRLGCAGARGRCRGTQRGVLRNAHQRVGLRGGHPARARGRRAHQRFLRRRRARRRQPGHRDQRRALR